MALAPEQAGIRHPPHFTPAGVPPYDEVSWDASRRRASPTGRTWVKVVFEQHGVEIPSTWSRHRHQHRRPEVPPRPARHPEERERSLHQVVDPRR